MRGFVTLADYVAYTGRPVAEDHHALIQRLLNDAAELIDHEIGDPINFDRHGRAIRGAACAQVAAWIFTDDTARVCDAALRHLVAAGLKRPPPTLAGIGGLTR